MRTLASIFEGILDADYDVDDAAIMGDVIKKSLTLNDMPNTKTVGEWLEFDCSTCGKEISFKTLKPIINAGYSKYRFINCDRVELYNFDSVDGGEWSDIEIDAPQAPVYISGNYGSVTLTNVKINAKNIHIDAEDSENMKIVMKKCIFNAAYIKTQAVTQLSIADTCRFPKCKLLYLGRIGKSVANKAAKLKMGLFTLSEHGFKDQLKSFKVSDEQIPEYWDIDVMKTLGLKPNKWPGLGKIVIVPNGTPAVSAPGLCLYHPGKTMLPISNRANKTTVEFKDGWHGTHVSRAKTELNSVTK